MWVALSSSCVGGSVLVVREEEKMFMVGNVGKFEVVFGDLRDLRAVVKVPK